jgi:hypothetical protein
VKNNVAAKTTIRNGKANRRSLLIRFISFGGWLGIQLGQRESFAQCGDRDALI